MLWFAFIVLIVVGLTWLFIRNVKRQSQTEISEVIVEDNFVPDTEEISAIQLSVQELNEKLPLHNMWDGFWIHELYQNELTISCSFNSIYYRNFDIIFDDVVFFNVPINWRDTNMRGNDFLRIASKEEFSHQQPDFDIQDLHVFAIDIYFNFEEAPDPHTFFVVASSVKLIDCNGGEASPIKNYTDPFPDDLIYSKRNKMP